MRETERETKREVSTSSKFGGSLINYVGPLYKIFLMILKGSTRFLKKRRGGGGSTLNS